ncbi:MAG TPA: hypothetical protein VJS43_07545 [Candidatus Acidoferrales bacterium]|nr:hypothetical protein [Candidatus Acidoferrales bacterium]
MLSEESSASAEKTAEVESPSLSASQQAKVREQLDRILASSLFRNSKRFPEFLRYTVNRALNEDTDNVKERTIGVEAFGRDPDYDTNVDPIVRVTAAAVRKRLAHYYREMGHEHELRIEFARGSYVPEFRFPSEEPPAPAIRSAETTPIAPVAVAPRRNAALWAVIACLAVPYFIYFGFQLFVKRPTALNSFWAPVTSTNAPALVCIPVMGADTGSPGIITTTEPAHNGRRSGAQPATQAPGVNEPDRVTFAASMALSTVSSVLGSMNKVFHVRHMNDASLNDLEDGPVVLIGGFTNRWTMNLDSGLRFDLARDGTSRYVADRRNASSRAWEESEPANSAAGFTDYAVISRVHSATTGRTLLTIAGLDRFGTQAAADCAAESSCIAAAESLQPGDWKTKNIQLVLQTTVIGGNPGEPKVIAAYLW